MQISPNIASRVLALALKRLTLLSSEERKHLANPFSIVAELDHAFHVAIRFPQEATARPLLLALLRYDRVADETFFIWEPARSSHRIDEGKLSAYLDSQILGATGIAAFSAINSLHGGKGAI